MPKPLADLYWDLRDRHLLPVVGLLIAAMIAAPILLSSKGGTEEEVPPVASASGVAGQTTNATFNVVPAGTSLRDYKKRLGHREPLNPFRQSGQAESASSSASGSETSSGEPGPGQESSESSAGAEGAVGATTESDESVVTTTVGGVTTEVPGETPEPTERGGDRNGAKEAGGSPKPKEAQPNRPSKPKRHDESTGEEEAVAPPTPSEPTKPVEPTEPAEPEKPAKSEQAPTPQVVVGYTIDAEAGFLPHATEKTEIAPLTKLPNAKHPVVVFMGLSQNHKRALFLMTGEVTAWYGGHCALEKQACQLVEVGLRKGATFAYGYGESRYRLRVKKITPTFAVRPASSGR